MANRIKGITVEIGGDTTKLSKALKNVDGSIKNTQTQLRDVNKLLKLDPGNTELLSQKHKLLAQAVGDTKQRLETLKTAAEQANDALAKGEISQSQYDALQREIVETEQELRRLETAANQSATAVQKIAATGEKLKTLGNNISNVGQKFLPATVAVAGLGTAAVKTAADFDSAMSEVSAVSGATGDDFDALRAKAREMGSKTKFSATEAANAMNYMAMAGWKTSDMLDGIEGIMNLAAASGEDLATTSDIVTDALTAFGLSAGDSAHFADILAAASSNANTNVSMMGETFKYCAPVAGALGFSAEDTAEAIGLMGNSGIKSSQAGTALRSIMNRLSKEVKLTGNAIGTMTIETTNQDGSMRSLNDILADCRVAFSKMSESEKAANAQALVGKNAMSGFLALMNAAPADIEKLNSAITNCDGKAGNMAETMQNNLAGQITILKSQLQELAISFGDILMPAIRQIVSWIQKLADKLNGMSETTKKTIVTIGLIVAAIGPALIVIGKVISSIGTIMTLVPKIKGAITAVKTALSGFNLTALLTNPITLVIAAVAALVAAFIHLWKTNEDFRKAITNIWNGIVKKFKDFFQGITDRLNALGFNFKDFGEVVKAVWDGFCSVLAPVFEGAFQHIADVLSHTLDLILSILDIFAGIFTGDWERVWNGVKGIFSATWNYIRSFFSNILNVLKNIFNVFLGWFGTSWEDLWNGAKDFFVNIWNGIKSFFSNIMNGIKATAETIWNAIAGFFQTIWNVIKTIFTVAVGAIAGVLYVAWNTIKTVIQTVWNLISGFFTTIWNVIKNTFMTVVNGIKNFLSTAWNTIKTVIETVWNAISSFFSAIWNAIKNTVVTVVTAIQNFLTNAWNTIKTVIETVVNAIWTVISTVFNTIKNFITGVMNAVHTVISTVWNTIKTVITTIVGGIQTFMSNAWNGIKNTITTVLNAIHTVVSNVFNAIKNVITSVMDGIKNVIGNIWNGIKNTVTNVVGGIKDGVSNLFGGMYNGVKGCMTNVFNVVKDGFGNVKDHIMNVASQAFSWGKDLVEGIGNGIRSGINFIGNAAASIGDKIRSFLHFSVPDEGPLTDYESWMPDFMRGLAQGIENSRGMIKSAMKNVSSDMVLNPHANIIAETSSTTSAFDMSELVKAIKGAFPTGGTSGGGDIVIPVYLGGTMLDEIIINAQQRANLRSGGR